MLHGFVAFLRAKGLCWGVGTEGVVVAQHACLLFVGPNVHCIGTGSALTVRGFSGSWRCPRLIVSQRYQLGKVL